METGHRGVYTINNISTERYNVETKLKRNLHYPQDINRMVYHGNKIREEFTFLTIYQWKFIP